MAGISSRLTDRRIASVSDREDGEPTTMTLAQLPRGSTGRVAGIAAGTEPAVARRLFDLGFAPGTEVAMVHRAPLADPTVFRVGGYEIALRRSQARCIQVLVPR